MYARNRLFYCSRILKISIIVVGCIRSNSSRQIADFMGIVNAVNIDGDSSPQFENLSAMFIMKL